MTERVDGIVDQAIGGLAMREVRREESRTTPCRVLDRRRGCRGRLLAGVQDNIRSRRRQSRGHGTLSVDLLARLVMPRLHLATGFSDDR